MALTKVPIDRKAGSDTPRSLRRVAVEVPHSCGGSHTVELRPTAVPGLAVFFQPAADGVSCGQPTVDPGWTVVQTTPGGGPVLHGYEDEAAARTGAAFLGRWWDWSTDSAWPPNMLDIAREMERRGL